MNELLDDLNLSSEQTLQRADFGMRLVAAIIDGLIISAISIPITLLLGSRAGDSTSFLSYVISWMYFALMESSASQATLGKKVMNIKVVGAQGQRLDFGQAFIRQLAKLISTFTCFIGYLMAAFRSDKQALHDIVSKMAVVKRS